MAIWRMRVASWIASQCYVIRTLSVLYKFFVIKIIRLLLVLLMDVHSFLFRVKKYIFKFCLERFQAEND